MIDNISSINTHLIFTRLLQYSHCFALPGILPRHPFSSSPGLLRSHDSKVLRVLSEKVTCRWYPSVHTNLSFLYISCLYCESMLNLKIENALEKTTCANHLVAQTQIDLEKLHQLDLFWGPFPGGNSEEHHHHRNPIIPSNLCGSWICKGRFFRGLFLVEGLVVVDIDFFGRWLSASIYVGEEGMQLWTSDSIFELANL